MEQPAIPFGRQIEQERNDMKTNSIPRFIVLAGILTIAWPTLAQETGEAKIVLTNCNVIDCTGNPMMENMTIL